MVIVMVMEIILMEKGLLEEYVIQEFYQMTHLDVELVENVKDLCQLLIGKEI